MMNFITYQLQVAGLIAVFYLCYRLLLSKETFHRLNRVVLLATAALSFILPLCVITMHQTVWMEMPQAGFMATGEVDVTSDSFPIWQLLVVITYIIGVLSVVLHTAYSTGKVINLIRNGKQVAHDEGIVIVLTHQPIAPFSWMHYIVLNEQDYADTENRSAIIIHERGHIHCHHSWDLLCCDLLTSLQWFNPVIWMLKADLRALHEYEADAVVLKQGINAKQYQYLLVKKAIGNGLGYSVANGINHSTLKNRINMMLQKKSHKMNMLKALFIIPVVGVTLAVQAETKIDYVTMNQESGTEVVQEGTIKVQGIVYGEDNKPMIGAVVRIDGSKKGTVTDLDGKFQLEATPGNKLLFEFIDYNTVACDLPKDAKDGFMVTIIMQKQIAILSDKTLKDNELYVDGVKVGSVDDIKPESIEKMDVVKGKDGEKSKIYITLKKK